MESARSRQDGKGELIRFLVGECSLGFILAATSAKGVCAILFGDDRDSPKRELKRLFPKADFAEDGGDLDGLLAKIIAQIEDPTDSFNFPLDIRGTDFEKRVWKALLEISAGSTASYAEIARKIGRPKAARAVARACAANRIAVAIPCHRVIHSDGTISGYGGGVERKRALLAREAGKTSKSA